MILKKTITCLAIVSTFLTSTSAFAQQFVLKKHVGDWSSVSVSGDSSQTNGGGTTPPPATVSTPLDNFLKNFSVSHKGVNISSSSQGYIVLERGKHETFTIKNISTATMDRPVISAPDEDDPFSKNIYLNSADYVQSGECLSLSNLQAGQSCDFSLAVIDKFDSSLPFDSFASFLGFSAGGSGKFKVAIKLTDDPTGYSEPMPEDFVLTRRSLWYEDATGQNAGIINGDTDTAYIKKNRTNNFGRNYYLTNISNKKLLISDFSFDLGGADSSYYNKEYSNCFKGMLLNPRDNCSFGIYSGEKNGIYKGADSGLIKFNIHGKSVNIPFETYLPEDQPNEIVINNGDDEIVVRDVADGPNIFMLNPALKAIQKDALDQSDISNNNFLLVSTDCTGYLAGSFLGSNENWSNECSASIMFNPDVDKHDGSVYKAILNYGGKPVTLIKDTSTMDIFAAYRNMETFESQYATIMENKTINLPDYKIGTSPSFNEFTISGFQKIDSLYIDAQNEPKVSLGSGFSSGGYNDCTVGKTLTANSMDALCALRIVFDPAGLPAQDTGFSVDFFGKTITFTQKIIP